MAYLTGRGVNANPSIVSLDESEECYADTQNVYGIHLGYAGWKVCHAEGCRFADPPCFHRPSLP
jgi:hypothetical protein